MDRTGRRLSDWDTHPIDATRMERAVQSFPAESGTYRLSFFADILRLKFGAPSSDELPIVETYWGPMFQFLEPHNKGDSNGIT